MKTKQTVGVLGFVALAALIGFFIGGQGITGEVVAETIEPELDGRVTLFDGIRSGFDHTPVKPDMPNHIYKKIDEEGSFVFLHFDKAVEAATKPIYTGVAHRGVFCKDDQERVIKKYGEGYTHFHKEIVSTPGATPEDGHGGKGGEKGYWFKHVALTDLDMPWGNVKPGIDYKFMPTPPPEC